MSSAANEASDPYSRAEYRRLIAWTRRIDREAPFLRSLLERAPDRSVVDIGCGTGEHTAFFAREGCRAVGVDRSEAMIDAARDHEARAEGRFVLGDVIEEGGLLADEPPFGVALCLGNMLPHVQEDEGLDRFVQVVRRLLAPGGVFLLQVLNYARIVDGGIRHLPVDFREGEDGEEIVFLRLMKAQPHGRILFFPTTLVLDADAEEPISVKTTRRVPLRAWRAEDLRPRLESAGFDVHLYGDMEGGPFRVANSHDLVVLAVRSPTS
ncbi:MAG: class I SAM-dependent methyltransferase [Planctomycetota bacterium]|jgi:SAM-dependent methyltransferase